MSKSVQSVKNSLKFKAQPKPGILSVKVGVKKFSVPVEARMLSNGDFVFLSFPASSELYRVENRELQTMGSEADASDAFNALNPKKRRGRRRAAGVSMPTALAEALKTLPPGYKLGYSSDGSPKLVRTRKRGAKGDKE
jgi:hypothetical protein